MMTSNVGLGELVRDLRATLEAISLGLTEGLPDQLLDAEPRLAEIAARLSNMSTQDARARPEAIPARRVPRGDPPRARGAAPLRAARRHGPRPRRRLCGAPGLRPERPLPHHRRRG